MKDLFGKAILDYQTGNNPQDFITETSISEADEMSVTYLFRGFDEMPKLEQKALELSFGKILDVGCGAGSHSLYLQDKGFDVTSIDISQNAITACELRGLKKAKVQDVMTLANEKFETLLLLMNGAGMCGRLKNISRFLKHLKSLLTEKGQILVDSSDIIYMFEEDEDGSKWIPGASAYYGEVEFTVSYKGETEKPFAWMYIDYNTLQNAAIANGLACELVMEGDHFDYLAKLSIA